MKCVICKDGKTRNGVTSVTLERDDMLFVIKQVPAQICSNCGEAYVDEKVTESILDIAERAFQEGIQIEICQYKVA
jgi:YgiT-type zinc finger domain-containing protein